MYLAPINRKPNKWWEGEKIMEKFKVGDLRVKMRDIRFRAWDKESELMLEVLDINWNWYGSKIEFITMMDGEGGFTSNPGQYVLMQYTGLKDKTKWEEATIEQRKGYTKETWGGVKIYEGDIVKGEYYTEPWVVEWDNYGGLEDGSMDPEIWMVGYSLPSDKLEKIGNIYENPELIKGD